MKFVNQIAAIILVMVILVESVGVQIIRDICLPCDCETIRVQLVLDDYEQDGCHSEKQLASHHHQADESCSCNPSSCSDDEHEHQKDIQVIANHPDFVESASTIIFSTPAIKLCAIFKQQKVSFAVERILFPVFQSGLKPLDPNRDKQSLLCSYLI